MAISLARVFFISLVLAVFLAGCGSATPTTNKATTPGGLMTPVPVSPTATPKPGPLPADIPVYPEAQLLVSQYITTGILYYYTVVASLEDVTSFYTTQMPNQGWTQKLDEEGPQGNLYVYTKDTRSVMLSLAPDPNEAKKTDISITLSNS